MKATVSIQRDQIVKVILDYFKEHYWSALLQ